LLLLVQVPVEENEFLSSIKQQNFVLKFPKIQNNKKKNENIGDERLYFGK
jgi:hypothetical protein